METFERDGLVFDVIDTGPPDGPVVILLHGFPQFADSWTQVTAGLTAQGYRCLAPNQRGYSPGAAPSGRRSYRTSELVTDVLALVDASGARKVHLVGHDWGAAVAWAFALRHRNRLLSLTALSVPHPGAMLRAMTRSKQFFSSWYIVLFQLPVLPELLLTGRGERPRGLAMVLRRTGLSEEHIARDTATMVERRALTPAINWYRAMAFSTKSAVGKAKVPTMFVWSDGDAAIRRKTAEACRDWVSGEYRYEVLVGVPHWIPDEAPGAVVPMMLEHLQAHRA